jgi:hypothetical protein
MLPIGNSKKESEVDLYLICALAAVDCYSVFFALNLRANVLAEDI